MPDGVLILRPYAAGDVTELLGSPDWNHYALVGQDHYDLQRGVYYNWIGGSFDKLDLYRWPMPRPKLDAITAIRHYGVVQRDNWSAVQSAMRVEGRDYADTFMLFDTTVQMKYSEYLLDPRTNLPWQWADLTPERVQWGIRISAPLVTTGGEGEPAPPEGGGIGGGGGGEGGWVIGKCFQTWLAVYYDSPGAVGAIQIPVPLEGALL